LFEGQKLHRLIEKIKLVLSCSLTARKVLLKIFPRAVIIPIVAINKNGEVVGLTYIKILNWLTRKAYSGVLGIVVKEKYQGRRVGYQMLLIEIKVARAYNIAEIWAYILPSNTTMLRLINKIRFKMVARVKHKQKGMWLDAYQFVFRVDN
jgi:L-amino acid N-acyltransferase YncA